MKRLWLLLGGLVIGGGLLTGCQSKSTTAESHKVNIVATTNFYGSVAKAVGGKHVSVTSIINKPSVDPHDFEPTPTVAKTVGQADLVIANGIGYDEQGRALDATSQIDSGRRGRDASQGRG